MGLNVFKWIYNLGVHHERQRIASHLRVVQAEFRSDQANLHDEFHLKNNIPRDKKVEAKVKAHILDIISSIFYNPDDVVKGNSVMFPEGEKKK